LIREEAMKRVATILTVALFVLIDSRIAWSWSGEGHRAVGAIADLILEKYPKVRDRVSSILGGNSLAEVSVWADCAKGFRYCHRPPSDEERAFAAQNRAHHAFHYTDVPIQQTAYHAGTAGTADNDIVAVTAYAINVLREKAPNHGPAVLNERDALWLLVHTVGDIHQPLHVGAVYFDSNCGTIVDPNVAGARLPGFGIDSTIASTKGGNDLKISKSRNLHAYWDGGTVKGAMRLVGVRDGSIEGFGKVIVDAPPQASRPSGDPETWPAQWATESLLLARSALTMVDIGPGTPVGAEAGSKCSWPVTLQRDYTNWSNRQTLTQLGKAGFRLADLLRVIFTPQQGDDQPTGSISPRPRR
jgi:S1/P1 Nuclease